jgi:exopolysaccharide biosynthesis WecB/TagA/CpsF family protein
MPSVAMSQKIDSKMEAALVAKASRTSMLWSKATSSDADVDLFGFQIDNATLDATATDLVRAASEGRRQRVAFLNAHVINVAAKDPAYARVLDGADRRFADGSGMALAARLQGVTLADNVNGTDLCPLLCKAAIDAGQTIFLLGGQPGVADAAAETLRGMGLGGSIAGVHHGYVKRGGEEEAEAIAAINASGASIVLVGMGVPVQDVWIARNFERIKAPVVIGVGGLFDFFAGRVSRAPGFLRGRGLEWTWRLAQEPSRMWKRYLVGNAVFIGRALAEATARRLGFDEFGLEVGSRLPHLRALWRTRCAPAVKAAAKRALDVAGSLAIGAVLALPVLLIAALIKLDAPGPVIFRQTRVGRNGRPFEMLKFRSMHLDAESLHAALAPNTNNRHELRFKSKRDPRVTQIGRFIRKTSIDELPQLWNVLRGDMSLVGPRPALPSEVAKYSLADRDRLLAKPGLTCTWQVNGRADIDFVGQVELDREYVRNSSFLRDLWLLIRTVPAVLNGRGAY